MFSVILGKAVKNWGTKSQTNLGGGKSHPRQPCPLSCTGFRQAVNEDVSRRPASLLSLLVFSATSVSRVGSIFLGRLAVVSPLLHIFSSLPSHLFGCCRCDTSTTFFFNLFILSHSSGLYTFPASFFLPPSWSLIFSLFLPH